MPKKFTTTTKVTIQQTDGLNHAEHTFNVDVSVDDQSQIEGPRRVAIEQHDWAAITEALARICDLLLRTYPAILNVTFEFHQPSGEVR